MKEILGESYFTDAKLYIDEDTVSKVILFEVHSTEKVVPRKDEIMGGVCSYSSLRLIFLMKKKKEQSLLEKK